MKRTYNSTFTMNNERLQQATIKIIIFDAAKYFINGNKVTWNDECDENGKEVKYTGLTAWDIIEGGAEAEEIEENGLIDENHEYLVLHFNDGSQATFRNSHVDMILR